eukprot:159884-Heterocapsa_arctica.AAC.1
MAIASATAKMWEKAVRQQRDLNGPKRIVDWTIPRKLLKKLDTTAPNDAGALRKIIAVGHTRIFLPMGPSETC